MQLTNIGRAAIVIGGATVVGGGFGAVKALKSDGGFGVSKQEGRSALADVLIGAGAGALAGIGLLGLRNVAPITSRAPFLGALNAPSLIGTTLVAGGLGYGAYSIANKAAN
jgi:hypothetical protein